MVSMYWYTQTDNHWHEQETHSYIMAGVHWYTYTDHGFVPLPHMD